MIRKLIAFLVLARVGMAPLTASVPILGSLSAGNSLNTLDVLALGAIGVCAHLFGFGLNALIDAPLDQTLPYYQNHPFNTGRLSGGDVGVFSVAQIGIAVTIYRQGLDADVMDVALLLLSMAASVYYNLWSKWGPLPRILSELSLAASIVLLSLSGAQTLSYDALVFAVTLGLILLLVNSLPSGLKDLKTDAEFGARSFVLASGATVQGEDAVEIPLNLHIYGGILQIAIIAGLVAMIFQWELGLMVASVTLLLAFFGALHLRMLLAVRSFDAIRQSKPLLNGYYNYAALLVILAPRMTIWLQILIGVVALLLLTLPLRLGWGLWRGRYVLD